MKNYRRETNTMPNWAGSCWYYLRYIDPSNTKAFVDPTEADYWLGPNHNATAGKMGGVDLYVGGVEHAVLHLLYARFWHKVLFDLGYVDSAEPFHKLFNNGYIQAYAYTDSRGVYVPAEEVEEVPGSHETEFTWHGEPVFREFGKMGKSLKNMVTPEYMYETYGADTFRLYEMSMGPLDESRPWNTRNVIGSLRFLQRLWRNVIDEETGEVTVVDQAADEKTLRLLNNTIADVTEEMENMRPNTAISKLIVLNNHLTTLAQVPRSVIEPLILMLSPMASHICEELWEKLGHTESLAHHPWPVADQRYVGLENVTAVVQIQGKVRAKLEVPPDISSEELEKSALALDAVKERLNGAAPRKVIVKPPKIVSIVI
jgi:leucyl-tRNA synthetase